MFCPCCGKHVPDDQGEFCNKCGRALLTAASPAGGAQRTKRSRLLKGPVLIACIVGASLCTLFFYLEDRQLKARIATGSDYTQLAVIPQLPSKDPVTVIQPNGQLAQTARPTRSGDGAARNITVSSESLAFTMGYIQDRLNSANGIWKETLHSSGGNVQIQSRYGITNAVADAKKCTLSYEEVENDRDDVSASSFDWRYHISLRDVAKATIESYAAYQSERGVPAEYVPPVYAVLIRLAPGKTTELHETLLGQDATQKADHVSALFFDQELARGMVKAISHAADLCGGGDHDPFAR